MALNVTMTELHPFTDLKSTWLLVHFYYTCILSLFLIIYGATPLLSGSAVWLFYRCHHYSDATVFPYEEGTFEEITRRHRLAFLKRETAVVVIYLLITLIWTWMFDIGPINSMRFTR
jgi:hypothetical protein